MSVDREGDLWVVAMQGQTDIALDHRQHARLQHAILTWTTYPERLQAIGISWQVYQERTINALASFQQFSAAKPGSARYAWGMAKKPAGWFESDAKAEHLPPVPWIVALMAAQSEHPDCMPAADAQYIPVPPVKNGKLPA